MKKLNQDIYNRLLLQAEEAKTRQFTKLSHAILHSLTATPEDEGCKYSFTELEEDVYKDLWAISTNVLKYHNLSTVDAEKLNETIETFASKFISSLEQTLNVEGKIGPLEEVLPGEKK